MRRYIKQILVICLFTLILSAKAQIRPNITKDACISAIYNSQQANDTVILKIWPVYISDLRKEFVPIRQFVTTIKNNRFKFEVKSLDELVYFELARGKTGKQGSSFISRQLIGPGDDINIRVLNVRSPGKGDQTKWGNTYCTECESFIFSGKGAVKNEFLAALLKVRDSLYTNYTGKIAANPTINERFNFTFEREINYVLTRELSFLKEYKDNIQPEVYQLIKANIIGIHGTTVYSAMVREYNDKWINLTISEKSNFIKLYKARMLKFENIIILSAETKIKSIHYPLMLLSRSELENNLFHHQKLYDRLKVEYAGLLRERIITNYLIDKPNRSKADSLFRDALSYVMYKPYRQVLSSLLKSQQIGTIAYNFSLPDNSGKTIKLSDFKGKLVFVDFWFTGCGGCSYYFQNTVSKAEQTFKNNPNVVFITISIDSNKELWNRGLKSGLFTSNDAINLYTNDQGINHPIIKQLNVGTYPHPLLIGKNSQILNNDINELSGEGADGLINAITVALKE